MRDITVQRLDHWEERTESIINQIQALKNNKDYSEAYKAIEIEKLYNKIDADKNNTWAEISKIMDERIKEAADSQKLKTSSSEHQQMISNALKMVEMIGPSMTADQMNNIIAPFAAANDYQTLSILKTYTDTKLSENARVGVEFPDLKTADVKRHTDMKNTFEQIFKVSATRFLDNGLSREMALRLNGQVNGYITKD